MINDYSSAEAAIYRAARQLQQQGRLAEAERNFKQLLKSRPGDVNLLLDAGNLALRAGQLTNAVNLFERLLKLKPGHFGALCNLGQALARQGKLQAALDCLGRARQLEPNNPAVHFNIGRTEQEAGHWPAAAAAYEQALALRPVYPSALINLGACLHLMNRPQEALQCYDQAVAQEPGNSEAWYARGQLLQKLNQLQAARQSYQRTLALQPGHAQAWYASAFCQERLGQPRDALACLDKAIALEPGLAEAHYLRGRLLFAAVRFDAAEESLREAARLKLADPDLLCKLALIHMSRKQWAAALPDLERAIALFPSYAYAHNLKGIALLKLQRDQAAIVSMTRAVELAPRAGNYLGNLGLALQETGRFAEAADCYEQALALDPNLADVQLNRCLSRLLAGEFEPGWRQYECRWEALKSPEPDLAQPKWLGEQDIAGKSMLITMEQGLGDYIQFSRYLPLLAAKGAEVYAETPAPLAALAGSLAPGLNIVIKGLPLPDTDYYCPIMSLPLAFGCRLDSVPAAVPYLRPEAPLAEYRLPAAGRPRIGLVCSGEPTHFNDARRSIPLQLFQPLLDLPYEFHLLQKDVRERDLPALARNSFIRRHRLDDFMQTAQLLEQMDVLLTVDTSVAHLAGALARPVWILLPLNPDFRWLAAGEQSPWYPSARLFRQSTAGDWPAVIAAVELALREAFPISA